MLLKLNEYPSGDEILINDQYIQIIMKNKENKNLLDICLISEYTITVSNHLDEIEMQISGEIEIGDLDE